MYRLAHRNGSDIKMIAIDSLNVTVKMNGCEKNTVKAQSKFKKNKILWSYKMAVSDRDYGKGNQVERAIGRYKRILGNRLHSREFERQRQEAIIGCTSAEVYLNKLGIHDVNMSTVMFNPAVWEKETQSFMPALTNLPSIVIIMYAFFY